MSYAISMNTTDTIAARLVSIDDDLDTLVTQINQAEWDEANEMTTYNTTSLSRYITHTDTLFVTCHDLTTQPPTLLGMASARIEMKPYDGSLWLYVDEVDVCANQRQRGAGKQLMNWLLSHARELGCEELWLGTEPDNEPANALYRSLKANEVETFVGYTYTLE